MKRESGPWLAYLRFEYRDKVRVLHLFCDTQSQLDEVFVLLKSLPRESSSLVEHVVFHSARSIHVREALNIRERHILTYQEFMTRWKQSSSGPSLTIEQVLEETERN